MASDCVRAQTYKDGVERGYKRAMEHLKLQHPVWDNTNIPPKVLLDMLVRNLEALMEHDLK